ncbi:MAG: hypothetical protein ABW033_10425 [Acidimicrobiia bacterium]
MTTWGQAIPVSAYRTYESLFDPGTHLPGWVLLLDRTTVALARAARNDKQVMVAVLSHPHDYTGARADMKATTTIIGAHLRRDDTLARVDEHTLVVVCNDLKADADAAKIARRLLSLARVQCNLGIVMSGGHDDPRSLLDLVMRDAREQRLAG